MHGRNSEMLAPMVAKLARRVPLGRGETQALLDLPCRIVVREAHSYLVREGDRSDHCVAILSGYAYRSKIAGSGARQIFSVHARGDVVDLQNSLLGEADHSVQALTRVDVAYIPHQALQVVTQAWPGIARALWHDTLVDGAIFREWLLNVGQRDARQRIAHLICELTLLQEEAGLSQGPQYDWPITQEQIGDATGLTSVHVNRTIQGLRRDALIDTGKRTLTIRDRPGLERAGDFNPAYLHRAPAAAA